MGFSIKFNWVLQTVAPETLMVGNLYSFEKSGNRVYPLDTPIDLIDASRVALAKIKIISFSNRIDGTTGEYVVVKVYEEAEQAVLTRYWKENQ